MKKKILIAAAAVCIAGGGVALFAGNASDPDILRSTVPAPHCYNAPDQFNGYCMGDGGYFFCERDGGSGLEGWDKKDCTVRR